MKVVHIKNDTVRETVDVALKRGRDILKESDPDKSFSGETMIIVGLCAMIADIKKWTAS